MYNILIWGTGQGYNDHFNLIKYFEGKGEISIVGIISNDKEIENMLDGYKFYKKSQIKELKFDYCLVTIKNINSILVEADELGILKQQLIPIRILEIPYFNFKKYIYLKEEGISIISRTCWAALCYHYLGLEFQSPTINLFFTPDHFNKFVRDLDYYLSQLIKFYKMEYERYLKTNYPVGQIEDILVYFNHYTDFETAKNAWIRRTKRMNKNKFFISSATERNIIMEFSKLPYKNKLIFIPKELHLEGESFFSVNYVPDIDLDIGVYTNYTANGVLSMIDILSFLCQMKYERTS